MEDKKIITGHSQGEITEKKSRFIANVYEIHSENEAIMYLEEIKKKYYDARHNCYAYVLGSNNEIQRFSDDKEPQGTAGKPILDVIARQGFHNTLIVVTRYFGGILLGTGGLTRAYSAAALQGLASANSQGLVSPVFKGIQVSIVCDYNLSGKIQYLIHKDEIPTANIIYGANVTYKIVLPSDKVNAFSENITELSCGNAIITRDAEAGYILKNGSPVQFDF